LRLSKVIRAGLNHRRKVWNPSSKESYIKSCSGQSYAPHFNNFWPSHNPNMEQLKSQQIQENMPAAIARARKSLSSPLTFSYPGGRCYQTSWQEAIFDSRKRGALPDGLLEQGKQLEYQFPGVFPGLYCFVCPCPSSFHLKVGIIVPHIFVPRSFCWVPGLCLRFRGTIWKIRTLERKIARIQTIFGSSFRIFWIVP
jgi:hypothetical protein